MQGSKFAVLLLDTPKTITKNCAKQYNVINANTAAENIKYIFHMIRFYYACMLQFVYQVATR